MQADDQATTARSDDAAAPAAQRKPGFSGAPLGKLGAAGDRPWLVTLESLLVPGIAVAVGVAFNPEDPLGVHAEFRWAWLAPVIVALRYGPLAGLGAGAVLLLAWVALHVGHMEQFPQIFFLGGLITVMLVGEFSSLWRARTRRAEAVQYYLDQRLEHLVRQHYLLRLSHDRLEQELIGRPMSMRDALSTLREVGRSDRAEAEGPATLLRLLAQYCQLESAAVYPVAGDQPVPQALASIGTATALQADDPLVLQALQTRKLCHISQTLAAQRDLAGVRALCDKYGILLVLDEIMCGTGRTGTFFAFEQEGVVPDIVTAAKGLGGGYAAIAGIYVHGKVIDALRQGSNAFNHGHTYQAHPISCAASLAVQKIVRREGLVSRCRAMGKVLESLLRAELGHLRTVGDIRGRGLFWAVEFVKDRETRETFDPKVGFGNRVQQEAFRRGVAVYPGAGTVDGVRGDHVLLAPPLVVTEEELRTVCRVLREAIEAQEAAVAGAST
ncbi:MAG: aminotransferase class III-fold pyridoxal phosphate-dependent enzyme [Acidovorax sp.]|nr:aminotransferase class III-fold pyridoxal phosphate-dependent enzyme [Acidovorax sp.]